MKQVEGSLLLLGAVLPFFMQFSYRVATDQEKIKEKILQGRRGKS